MISTCHGKRVTGSTALQIAKKYEKLARDSEIDKDRPLVHFYRQHAEHWRRQG